MTEEPPPHVREAWERLHAELQRRLGALWDRRAPFKLWVEVTGEGGLPRLAEWYEHDRQQPGAWPRKGT